MAREIWPEETKPQFRTRKGVGQKGVTETTQTGSQVKETVGEVVSLNRDELRIVGRRLDKRT